MQTSVTKKKKPRSTNNDSLVVSKNKIDRNKQLEYYCTHLKNSWVQFMKSSCTVGAVKKFVDAYH